MTPEQLEAALRELLTKAIEDGATTDEIRALTERLCEESDRA